MKVKFYYAYQINIDIETEKNIEVYIDQCNMDPVPENSIRIVILEEPLKSSFYYQMKERTDLYTYLLTFHDEILTTNSKSRLFHFPNSWIKNYTMKQKKFCISTVVGGKSDPRMEGYELRHNLWRNKERILIPKEFYLSGSAPHSHGFVQWIEGDYNNSLILGTLKEPLFDSMFHVAIENTSIKNYFSEKIIDCFQSRTIPIYYGCINIGDFFNSDGIIIVHNIEEIVNICNNLTSEIYDSKLPAIEDNYNISFNWCDAGTRLIDEINKIIL